MIIVHGRPRRFGRIARGLVVGGVLASTAALAGPVGSAHAAPALIISEVAPWGSGNSTYAADWFELTNKTGAAIDITGWKMDDSSGSFASSVPMSGVTSIGAGQSAIFLESSTPSTTIPLFTTSWFGSTPPAGLLVGTYSGSGVGLSTGGDGVNVFNSTGSLQASVSFGASPSAAPFATFDNAAGLDGATISTLSVAGVNGAFLVPAASNAAIGSPGTVVNGSTTTTTTAPASTTPATTAPPTTVAGGTPWPGSQTVHDVSSYVFGGNLSGLIEEGSGTAAPGILWGVRNGPGALYRLVWDGSKWVPDSANGWATGKALHYGDGTGDPDSEGVTFAGNSASNGIFVSTERNNSANTTSKLSVLRFDPTAGGTSLNATMEWNLTADIPPTGPNLGLEAITWIPDSYLVGNNFYDAHASRTYNPNDYANHDGGLFFVGVEGSGMVYAYALDQVAGGYTRVASFPSSFPAIMELQFDRDLNELWAVCDNTCNGQHALMRIDPATGAFSKVITFERPASMPNYNNEGFAIAPATECVNGFKPVYWADDTEDLGVSIRSGTVSCTAYVAAPPTDVPEFPFAAASTLLALTLVIGFVYRSRRRTLRLA